MSSLSAWCSQRVQRFLPSGRFSAVVAASGGSCAGWWMHDAVLLVDYGWLPLLGRSVLPSVVLAAIMSVVSLVLFLPWRLSRVFSVAFVLSGAALSVLPRFVGFAVQLPMQVPPSAPKTILGLALATGASLWFRRFDAGDHVTATVATRAQSRALLGTFGLGTVLGAGMAAVVFGLRLGNLWSRDAAASLLVLLMAIVASLLVLVVPRRRAHWVVASLVLVSFLLLGLREREWRSSSWSNELEVPRSMTPLGKPTRQTGAQPINLVLITLDTVRAQNLFVRDYDRNTMPQLSQWVRKHAVNYTNARSASSWTWPSHATLFTGLSVAEHGAAHLSPPTSLPGGAAAREDRLFLPLKPTVPTLAGELAKNGYATAGVVANSAVLNPDTGIGRGFEWYFFRAPNELPVTRPLFSQALGRVADLGHKPYLDAAVVRQQAELWLSRVEEEPFFLFVNFFDAHSPWIPNDTVRSAFGPKQPPDPIRPARRDLELLYDRELLYLDGHLAKLLGALRQRDDFDRTLVVITSDHGESFGRHTDTGETFWGHAKYLYEDLLHVPLFVRSPSTTARIDSRQVDATDVTELIMVGLRQEKLLLGVQEASVHEAKVGTSSRRRPTAEIYRSLRSRQDPTFRDRLAWVEEGRKIIVDAEGRVEAYDLRQDPEERHNQVTEAERVEYLARAKAWWSTHPLGDAEDAPELDEATLKRLKSLGYLGGGH